MKYELKCTKCGAIIIYESDQQPPKKILCTECQR